MRTVRGKSEYPAERGPPTARLWGGTPHPVRLQQIPRIGTEGAHEDGGVGSKSTVRKLARRADESLHSVAPAESETTRQSPGDDAAIEQRESRGAPWQSGRASWSCLYAGNVDLCGTMHRRAEKRRRRGISPAAQLCRIPTASAIALTPSEGLVSCACSLAPPLLSPRRLTEPLGAPRHVPRLAILGVFRLFHLSHPNIRGPHRQARTRQGDTALQVLTFSCTRPGAIPAALRPRRMHHRRCFRRWSRASAFPQRCCRSQS